MDNVAEGFDDSSSREFTHFLGYVQRSCGEVQSQLYRALDCGYISNSEFKVVYDLASECRMQIKDFRKYLRNYKKLKNKHDLLIPQSLSAHQFVGRESLNPST
jgi:hypothetical protein|tara:strand:+ start:333 stop:641 length:309 start_codon:yes stop_codon:yes gene_type:complete